MLFIKRHKDEVKLPMTAGRSVASISTDRGNRTGMPYLYDNIAIVTRKYDILKLKAFYPFTISNFIFPFLKSIGANPYLLWVLACRLNSQDVRSLSEFNLKRLVFYNILICENNDIGIWVRKDINDRESPRASS